MLNRLKRFLALTLSMVMFISMMPMDVLAETVSATWDLSSTAATYASDYTLTGDGTEVTASGTIYLEVGSSVTLTYEQWDGSNSASYSSSDSDVASVGSTSRSGWSTKTYTATLTANAVGVATVSLSSYTTLTVNVVAASPRITISGDSELDISQSGASATLSLAAANLSENVAISSVEWTVSGNATLSNKSNTGVVVTPTNSASAGNTVTVTAVATLNDGTDTTEATKLTTTYTITYTSIETEIITSDTLYAWINEAKTITGTSSTYNNHWTVSNSSYMKLDNWTGPTTTSTYYSTGTDYDVSLKVSELGMYTVGHSWSTDSSGSDNNTKSQNIVVIVYGVKLNSLSDMYVGETQTVTYTSKLPNGATLSWSEADKTGSDVIDIDATTGVITAKSAGTATVTLTVTESNNTTHTYTTEVEVLAAANVAVSKSAVTLPVGDSTELTVTGATDSVTFYTSDATIATCSYSAGKLTITGVKAGDAVVYGVTTSGDTVLVDVTVETVGINVEPGNLTTVGGNIYYVYPDIVVPSGATYTITVSDSVADGDLVTGGAYNSADGSIALTTSEVSAKTDVTVTFTMAVTANGVTTNYTDTISVMLTTKDANTTTYYNVTFYDYYGNLLSTQTVANASAIVIPDLSKTTITGYTYAGFDVASTADVEGYKTGDTIDAADLTANTILFAQYNLEQYDVTFTTTYGTAPAKQTVSHGGMATEPADLGTSGNYEFSHWYLSTDSTEAAYNFYTPVTDDINLVAKWEPKTITVTLITYLGVYQTYTYNYVDQKWYNSSNTEVTSITLPQFTSSDKDSNGNSYYQYTIVNTTSGKSKPATFKFWVLADDTQYVQKNGNSSLDLSAIVSAGVDVTYNAIYEPSSSSGTESNGSHANTVNVTVQLVDEDGNVKGTTVLTDIQVTPAYNNKTLMSGYTTTAVNSSTAKFGTISVDDLLGKTVTINGTNYTVTDTSDVSVSDLNVVWLCTQASHVYGGTCRGGTWNALGVITLTVRETLSSDSAPKLRVNYYQVSSTDYNPDDAVLLATKTPTIAAGNVLVHSLYEKCVVSSTLTCIGHEWENGVVDGTLARNGNYYVLNLYYYAQPYTVTYHYLIEGTKDVLYPSVTVENLLNGYSHSQVSPSGDRTDTTDRDESDYTLVNPSQAVVNVTIDGASAVVYVYYKLNVGTLTINKTVEGDLPAATDGKYQFTFTVTDTTDSNDKKTVTVVVDASKKTGSASISLPVGTYSVTENPVTTANGLNYATTITTSPVTITSGGTATVNVTNKQQAISVSGTKTWDDETDQDGVRPSSITIKLLADGEEKDSKTVSASDNWSWSFKNLPKYDTNGKEIGYTISESAVNGYTSNVSGYNVTNTHEVEKVNITVTKAWNDNDDQDGIRPSSVQVQLKANDKASGDAVTLNEANGWTYTWENMDKNASGAAIAYTVEETDVPTGYTVAVTGSIEAGFTVTNTHTPATTDVVVTKTWDDAGNQDGQRTETVVVELKANGASTGKTVILSAGNSWSDTFKDLAVYNNKQPVEYSVEELKAGDSVAEADQAKLAKYATTYKPATVTGVQSTTTGEGDAATTTTEIVDSSTISITNAYTPEQVSVIVNKTWDDADDQDGIRPETVTIELYEDGNLAQTDTIGSSGTVTFSGLAKYKNGNLITYTVTEDAVEGYTSSEIGQLTFVDNVATVGVTNTHVTEDTSVSVTKVWDDAKNQDGIRPESVQVQLYIGAGEDRTAEGSPVTLNADNQWTYTWTELDKNANGEEIVYTVDEIDADELEGYEKTSVTSNGNAWTITNKHNVAKTAVSVTKVWDDSNNQDGKRTSEVTVQLYADGTATGAAVTLNDDNNWSYTWNNLDEKTNGKSIKYTVDELSVPTGYTKKITGAQATGYTITNSHVTETTSVTVEKVWSDNNNQDGKRPNSVTINLLANGEEVAEAEVSSTDSWKHTFDNLPKYASGSLITYTVTEDEVADYTASVNGYTITNTHTPETITISGEKTWSDADNQDGKRPSVITIRLKANGTEVRNTNVTAANDWKWSFSGLPKYENGNEITYTITEDAVTDYESSVNGYDVTNTHETEKTSVVVTKIWNDDNDRDNARPTTIELTLTGKIEGKDTAVVTKPVTIDSAPYTDASQTYTFENLDKYAAGKEITYTVSEKAVDGYTTTYSADTLTITNTRTYSTTTVMVTKEWVDSNNQDGMRPASIKVHLLADGTEVDSADVTAEEGWEYTFTDLPVNKTVVEGDTIARSAIVYTVTEDAVAKYTTSYSEDTLTITNTHTPETITVSGSKTWNDNNDQDGKRPESITIRLWANGEEEASQIVTSESDWSWNFTDLAKYANGQEIVYTITEDEVTEYTSNVNGYDVTNTHVIEKTSVTVSKAWDDADDQDGLRPDSVTVTLYADGTKTDHVAVLSSENEWTETFSDLDVYANGEAIEYTIVETTVANYTASYDPASVSGEAENHAIEVTNTHIPATVSVNGSKSWTDNTNETDKNTYPKIIINLLADGEKIDDVEINGTGENGWSWSFTNLPKYKIENGKGGKEIVYTITEDNVNGYSSVMDGYNVTNTRDTASLTVEKKWETANGRMYPVELVVERSINQTTWETYKTVTLTAAKNWTVTYTDVPTHTSAGKQYTYRVRELEVNDVTVVNDSVTVDNVTKFNVSTSNADTLTKGGSKTLTVTNKLQSVNLTLTVNKTWKVPSSEEKSDEVQVTLYQRAIGATEWKVYETVTFAKSNSWTLPKYDVANRVEYEYKVVETAVDNYSNYSTYYTNDDVKYTGECMANFGTTGTTDTIGITNVKNTNAEDIQKTIVVNKHWVDSAENMQRDNVVIDLLHKQDATDDYSTTKTNTIVKDDATGDTWSTTFTAPIYVWLDSENEVTTDVTKFDHYGVILYGAKETSSHAGYTNSGTDTTDSDNALTNDVFDVTNTIKAGSKSISVTKTWDASYTTAEAEATFTLYQMEIGADPEKWVAVAIEGITNPVTVKSGDENQTITWSGLPQNNSASGNAYSYKVVESKVEGYTSSWTNNEASADTNTDLTVTNTIKNDVTIKFSKQVEDTNDLPYTGKFQFQLYYVNGNDKVLLTKANCPALANVTMNGNYIELGKGESITITGLAHGSYVVEEVNTSAAWTVTTEGALTDADGQTFTNTRNVTAVTAEKNWVDLDNKYNLRPTLNFYLYAEVLGEDDSIIGYADSNGNVIAAADVAEGDEPYFKKAENVITATGSNKTSFDFANLPAYTTDGKKIHYYVEEEMTNMVMDYALTDTKVDGTKTTFTNSLVDDDANEITVNKAWDLNDIALRQYPTLTFSVYYGKSESDLTALTAGGTPVTMTITEGGTSVTLSNKLPKLANGYSYYIKETGMDGDAVFTSGEATVTMLGTEFFDFDTAKNQVVTSGGTITNTAKYGAFTITKTIDNNGAPWPDDSVKFTFDSTWVTSDGQVKTVTLAVEVDKNTKTNTSGQIVVPLNTEITVNETQQDGWTADKSSAIVTVTTAEAEKNTVDNVSFTNTRKVVSVSADKTWKDNDNAAGLRPALTYNLYGTVVEKDEITGYVDNTGAVVAEKKTAYATETKSAASYAVTWNNLPAYTMDNKAITWVVEESVGDSALNYTTDDADLTNGGTFVNTVTNDVEIEITKNWVRNGVELTDYPTATFQVYYGKSEDNLTALKINGVDVTVSTETDADSETLTISKLPRLAAGYSYYIKETYVTGGTAVYDGMGGTVDAYKLFTCKDDTVEAVIDENKTVDGKTVYAATITNSIDNFRAYTITKKIDLKGTSWTGDAHTFTFTADTIDVTATELTEKQTTVTLQPSIADKTATSAQIIVPKTAEVEVTERIDAGWNLTDGNDKTVTLSDSGVAKVVFTNERAVTTIAGTKTWAAAEGADIPTEITLVIERTNTVTNKSTQSEETVAITDGKFVVDEFDGYKMATHDEDGYAYSYAIVSEKAIEGYEIDYANNNKDITNTQNATLIIKKAKGANVTHDATFGFTVATENGKLITPTEGTANIRFNGSATFTVKGNSTYTITEAITDGYYLTGVAITINGTAQEDVTVNNTQEIKIPAGAVVEITYTNAEQLGEFTVNKTGSGSLPLNGVEFTLYKADANDTLADAMKNDVFDTVTTVEDYAATADVNEEGTAVFSKLPIGTYYVVETKQAAGYQEPNAESQSAKIEVIGNDSNTEVATVKIDGSEINATTITNALIDTTSFVLQKKVVDGLYDTTANKFKFTIKLVNTNADRLNFSIDVDDEVDAYSTNKGEIEFSVSLAHDELVTIEGMPLDTVITVTENDVNADAWKIVWNDDEENTGNTAPDVVITEDEPAKTLTATNTRVTKKLTATKTWSDQDNYFNLRPTTIEYKLYRYTTNVDDAKVVDTVSMIVESGNTQTIKVWENLPAYDADGVAYNYYIDEADIANYTASNDGTANKVSLTDGDKSIKITNTLNVNQMTVKKSWVETATMDDGVAADIVSARPSMTFTLTNTDWAQLNETVGMAGDDADYSVVFARNMPISKAYELAESMNGGGGYHYENTAITPVTDANGNVIGFDVENTLKTMDVTVTKEWDDNGITGLKHPNATFELYYTNAKGVDIVVKTISAPTENENTYKFVNVPLRTDYKVRETALNYAEDDVQYFSVNPNSVAVVDGAATITNESNYGALVIEKAIDMRGTDWDADNLENPTFTFKYSTKVDDAWVDAGEVEVTVDLAGGKVSNTTDEILFPVGTEVKVREVLSDNQQIEWLLDEADSNEELIHVIDADDTDAEAYFENDRKTIQYLNVIKTWEDKNGDPNRRPESVTFGLYYSDGTTPVLKNDKPWTITLETDTAVKKQTVSFDNVPYNANGYVVIETMLEGTGDGAYIADKDSVKLPADASEQRAEFTNYPTEAVVTVKKQIEDNTIDSVNGMESKFNISVDNEDKSSATIGDFDIDGEKMTFEVKIGTKYTLTENIVADDWTASYENATKETDTTATFTADEAAEEIVVTNTRNSVTLTLDKTWIDDNNAQGTRPETIDVIVEVKDGDTWTAVSYNEATVGETGISAAVLDGYKFTDYKKMTLPKTDLDGKVYEYRLNEVLTNGVIEGQNGATYTSKVTEDGTTTKITNQLGNGTTSISFTKNWVDNSNELGGRPDTTDYAGWLHLYQSTDEVKWTEISGTASVSGSDDTYSVTYSNLPRFDNEGKLYYYAVAETIPTGSEYTQSGATIEVAENTLAVGNNGALTNTLVGTTEITIVKKWLDGDDVTLETIPETKLNTALTRYVNDEKTAATAFTGAYITLTADDKWTTKVTVDKYDADGALYKYGVVEYNNAVGYIADMQTTGLSNSITAGSIVKFSDGEEYKVSYTAENNVQIIWNTRQNDDKVPGTKTATNITLNTYVDGEKVDVGDSWTYTITWNNTTNEAQVITITDELKPYLTHTGHTGSSDNTVTAVTGAEDLLNGKHDEATNTVTWKFIAKPFHSGSVTVTVRLNNKINALYKAEENLVAENKATVEIGPDVELKNDAIATPIPVSHPAIGVVKEITTTNEDGEVKRSGYKLGETVSYKVTVTNTGNLTLTDVKVVDIRDGATVLEETIETMAPGAVEHFTYTHTVTEADLERGNINNMVTVTADDPTTDEGDLTDSDRVSVKTETVTPELTLVKAVTTKAGGYELGETVSYMVTLTNTGNVTLHDVIFTDDHVLDYATVTVDGATAETVTENGKITGLNVGDMVPGKVITFTYDYVIVEADLWNVAVLNTATATGIYDTPDPDQPIKVDDEETVTTVGAEPAIDVTKAVVAEQDDYYTEGETVDFTITVTNTGNVTLYDVTLTDEMTNDLPVVIAPTDAYTVDTAENGTVTVTMAEPMLPGDFITLSASYEVLLSDLQLDTITNKVTAAGETEKGDKVEDDDAATADFKTDTLITYTVDKVWKNTVNDVQPDNVTVELKRNGATYKTTTLNEENGWKYTFENLPMHDTDHKLFDYKAVETYIGNSKVENDAANGYDVTYSDEKVENAKSESITITNTQQTTSVVVTKYWVDGEWTEGTKPADHLLAFASDVPAALDMDLTNDQSVASGTKGETGATIDKSIDENGAIWTYTFTALPIYDAEGDKITYSATEGTAAGFTAKTETTLTVVDGKATFINAKDDEKPQKPVKDLVEDETDLINVTLGDENMAVDGGTITYTIAWSNNFATTQKITVTDTLPTGLEYTGSENTVNTKTDVDGQTITWTFNAKPFEDGVITVTVDVDRAAIIAAATEAGKYDPTVTNTAQMIVSGDDVKRESNPVETSVYNPIITVVKEVTDESHNANGYQFGEEISYKVTITNDGNVPLLNVNVADTIVAASDMAFTSTNTEATFENGVISRMDIGDIVTLTYTYTVTEANVEAGNVVNKVTATGTAESTEKDEVTDDADTTSETYAASGSWIPTTGADGAVGKTIVGRDLVAGEFKFEITDVTHNNKTIIGTNDADGNVTFDGAFTYTLTDLVKFEDLTAADDEANAVYTNTFKYIVKEISDTNNDGKDDDGTVDYSNDVYTYTVTYTDNGDGTIVAVIDSITMNDDGKTTETVDEVVFDNYAHINATVTKAWENVELVDVPDVEITLYRKAGADKPEAVDSTWYPFETKTIASGKTSVTWENLERVDEHGVEYTYIATETVQGDFAGSYTASAVVVELGAPDASNVKTAGFTNSRDLGAENGLSVTKNIVNDGKSLTDEMKTDKFDFVVTVPGDMTVGDTITYTVGSTEYTATIQKNDTTYGTYFVIKDIVHGQTATVTNKLPIGTYNVVELQNAENAYDYAADWGEATNKLDLDENKTVAFTATNTVLADGFSINKLWKQPNGNSATSTAYDLNGVKHTATFGLFYDAEGKTAVQQNGKNLVSTTTEAGVVVFENVALTNQKGEHATYYIKEISTTTDNYVLNTAAIPVVSNGTKFDIDAEQQIVVNELQTYDLTIQKVIDWNGTDVMDIDFTIDYSYDEAGAASEALPVDESETTADVTGKVGASYSAETGKITHTGNEIAVPYGTKVTVTEKLPEADEDGNYVWTNEFDGLDDGESYITVNENADHNIVTVTNTRAYNPELTADKVARSEYNIFEERDSYELGDLIDYEIEIENTGNVTLTNVKVTDSRIDLTSDDVYFEAGREDVTFDKETSTVSVMKPGDVIYFLYQVEITEDIILEEGNVVINTVTVSADDPKDPENPVEDEDEADIPVEEPAPSIEVVKTSEEHEGDYELGETINYTIVVTNTGNLTISNITVTDELTGDQWTIESLAPKASETFTASYTVTETDLFADEVINVATATGKDPTGEDITDEDDEKDPTDDPNDQYTVVKTLTNLPERGYFVLGEKAEFEITVTNTGNLTLYDVIVTEQLQGATFVAESIEGVTYTEDGTSATIDQLDPVSFETAGEVVVLHAEYTITEDDLGKTENLGEEGAVHNLNNILTSESTHNDPDDPDPVPTDPDPIDPVPVPVDDVTTVAVTKVWNDVENQFGTRQTITVNLLADGEIYKTATISADENGAWTYTFDKLPVHNADTSVIEYTVVEETVAGYDTAYESVETEDGAAWTITNTLQQYTLTVRYWYEQIGGEVAADTFTRTYYYGESYNVTSPKINGYSVDIEVVSGVITGNAEYDVIYTPIDYKLTVYYVYEDGTTAAPTHRDTLHIDDDYRVVSPELDGYVASRRLVSGTMPGHDLVYTVIYVPATVIIDEYGVPLNIGSIVMNVGDCFE